MKSPIFRIAVLMTLFLNGVAAGPFLYAYNLNDNPDAGLTETQMVTGSVADVDWEGGIITLNVGSNDTNQSGEITVKVPDDALVTRGGNGISLEDIEVNDFIRIAYVTDRDSGTLIGRRIEDMNQANE